MKRCGFRSGFAAMPAALAALMALASAPVAAQNIVVNGASCPTATISLTSAGLVAVLPTGCSGNGSACASASITYSSTGIAIQAPASCATAPDTTPITLQSATVNGNSCNTATVTLTATGVSINAPAACLITTVPAISSIGVGTNYVGQAVTISGSNFAAGATVTVGGVAAVVIGTSTATSIVMTIPNVATGSQPVIVTAGGQSSASFPMSISPLQTGVMSLLAVQSRKIHGNAGTFDLPVDTTQAIGGAVTVEPRSAGAGAGAGHMIVFQFLGGVTSAGTISAVDSTGATIGVSAQVSGSEIAVTLANPTDGKRISVSLTGASGVNGTANATASIGFLLGDINNSRAVNSSDISGMKARSGEVTTAANFKFDVNASGAINSSDISSIKARSGSALP